MPVDSRHPEYEARCKEWKTIRDVVAGLRAIRAGTTLYLPKLFNQSEAEYGSYLARAMFFGAPARTLEAFQGMLTRKAPKVEAPKDAKDFLADCDLQNGSFLAHVQSVIWELLNTAAAGTLLDWNEKLARPYLTMYNVEQFINWDVANIGGKVMLSFVMLEESSTEWSPLTGHPAPDGYAKPSYEQWREFRLEEKDGTYKCTAKVWRKPFDAKGQKDSFILIETRELTRRGQALPFIPYQAHGLGVNPLCLEKPIGLDLADVAISQYQNSADYENGLHIAGLPTPWAAGFTDDTKTVLALGVSRAWVSPDVNAKCGFLEFTGQGLQALQGAIKDKSEMMAALGARILDAPTNAAEATETVKLRQTSESNVLTDLAASAEQTLSMALRMALWWMGTEADPMVLRDTVYVAINKDLLGSKLPPAMLQQLLAALQANSISFETFFWNMQQGNMYADGVDLEKEKLAIEQNPPPPPLPVDPNIQPDPAPDPAAKPGEKKPTPTAKPPLKKAA